MHGKYFYKRRYNIFCWQGGVNKFEEEGGRGGYWGWYGYGGSVFQWQPDLKLGSVDIYLQYL